MEAKGKKRRRSTTLDESSDDSDSVQPKMKDEKPSPSQKQKQSIAERPDEKSATPDKSMNKEPSYTTVEPILGKHITELEESCGMAISKNEKMEGDEKPPTPKRAKRSIAPEMPEVGSANSNKKETAREYTQQTHNNQTMTSSTSTDQSDKIDKEFIKQCKMILKEPIVNVGDEEKLIAIVHTPPYTSGHPDQIKPHAEVTNITVKENRYCKVNSTWNMKGNIYEIFYTPDSGGLCELHVKMAGKEVTGSPFIVRVKTQPKHLNKRQPTYITDSELEKPWGMAVNRENEIIVATKKCISIFNPKQEKPRTIGKELMKSPTSVAVDTDDNIIVIDSIQNEVLKLSQQGTLLARQPKGDLQHTLQFQPEQGESSIQFKKLAGVCFNEHDKNIYVLDQGAKCIYVFTSDLEFSDEFCFECDPSDIASDSEGYLYIADTGYNRVLVIDSLGEIEPIPYNFDRPVSICVDSEARLYVGEKNGVISVFTKERVHLESFKRLLDHGTPRGIAVCNLGLLYISDHDHDRVCLCA